MKKLLGLGLFVVLASLATAQNFAVRGIGVGEHIRGAQFYGMKMGDAVRGTFDVAVMTPRGPLMLRSRVVRMDIHGESAVVSFAAQAVGNNGQRFHIEGMLTDGGAPEHDDIAFVVSDPAGHIVFRGDTQRQTVEVRRA